MAKAKKKAKSKAEPKVTIATARKVRDVVKAGLVKGLGNPVPGEMCIEAAVNYAQGRPHGDNPACVGSAVRAYKIRLNDANWSSNQARAKGMLEVAIAQLGSNKINQRAFADHVVIGVIKQILPISLRAWAKRAPEKAEVLEGCAVACEAVTDLLSARAAARAAREKYDGLGFWWRSADAADAAAAAAAAAADAAAADAADAAADAADAAADAAARDGVLSLAAKIAVDALKKCKAQGVKWLKLAA